MVNESRMKSLQNRKLSLLSGVLDVVHLCLFLVTVALGVKQHPRGLHIAF